jgi:hypothetical protein
MEAKLKHLEFVQVAVSRMAGNSFLLRGWSVTLAAGLFALAAKDTSPMRLSENPEARRVARAQIRSTCHDR